MYVVIEGIDTAGKSTQLDILKEKRKDAIFTKEPGGTKLGIKIREMVLNAEANSNVAEMLLFLADRAEHINEIILPNKDKLVISDRSLISGIAYAKSFDLKLVCTLNLIATQNILPDKVILLKLSKEELENRLSQKEIDGIEKRGSDYLIDIQNRMIEVLDILKINCLIIDAKEPISVIEKEIEDYING